MHLSINACLRPAPTRLARSWRSKKNVDEAAVALLLACLGVKRSLPFGFRQGGCDRSTTTAVAQPASELVADLPEVAAAFAAT